MPVIYKITNIMNGKIYIGRSQYDRLTYLGSGVWIKRAIKKYGRENFKKVLLETCVDKNTACAQEIYWIDKLSARNPLIGYNITVGGDGVGAGKEHPCFGKALSEETRKKISNANKGSKNYMFGTHHSTAWKQDISLQMSGEKHPMFGKCHTEEAKKKMSLSSTGNKNRLGSFPSEETRRKMSAAKKGCKHSEEWKQRVSRTLTGKYTGEKSSMFGKHHSEEAKKKMSAAKKGIALSFERKQQLQGENHPMFGKHHSEEAKKKMSLARIGKVGSNLGRHFSVEWKLRMAEVRKGKVASEETRNKLSEAAKRFWAARKAA